MAVDGFKKFKDRQYGRAKDGWTDVARPGDVVVMNTGGLLEGGNIGSGSNNSLSWAEKGIVSVVSNGGVR